MHIRRLMPEVQNNQKTSGRLRWSPPSEVQRTAWSSCFQRRKTFPASSLWPFHRPSLTHLEMLEGLDGMEGGEGRKVQSAVSSRVRNIGGELGEFGLYICFEAKLN